MTKGLVRFQQSGDFHFVTFSCYHDGHTLGRRRPAISSSAPWKRYGHGTTSLSPDMWPCPNMSIF